MQAGGTLPKVIRVTDPDGAPVLGLELADFVTSALGRGYGATVWSTYAANFALVEISNGRYALDFKVAPSAGHYDVEIDPVDTTLTVTPNRWQDELESQDLDSLFGSIVKPVLMPTQGAILGMPYPGQLAAYRWAPWSIPVKDQAGNDIDLSSPAYDNLKLSVRSKDQTTIKLDAENGTPTGFVLTGALGLLTIEWPETTGAVDTPADIYGWLALGAVKADALYYEVTGDKDGDPDKTVPIIRSSELLINRREVGS